MSSILMTHTRSRSADSIGVVKRRRGSIGQGKAEFTATHGDKSLGVAFTALPPGPLMVKTVLPGHWADDKGIETGDAFLAVNGHTVLEMSRNDFFSMMQARPVTITVGRLNWDAGHTIVGKSVEEDLAMSSVSTTGSGMSPHSSVSLMSPQGSENRSHTPSVNDEADDVITTLHDRGFWIASKDDDGVIIDDNADIAEDGSIIENADAAGDMIPLAQQESSGAPDIGAPAPFGGWFGRSVGLAVVLAFVLLRARRGTRAISA